MSYSWIVFALLSAVTASLVAIFGKIGLQGIDTNTATAIRAAIMTLFLIGVIAVQGKLHEAGSIIANNRALLFIALSGIAGALSWLFYFVALKNAKVSQIVPIDRLSVIGAALMVAGGILVALG
jgi:transporter family protein